MTLFALLMLPLLLEAGVVAGKLETEEKGRDRSTNVLVNRSGLWTKLE